jgi:hypothetical protein
VVGTAPTFDDDTGDDRIFVLFDPRATGEVDLWVVDDGRLRAIEIC